MEQNNVVCPPLMFIFFAHEQESEIGLIDRHYLPYSYQTAKRRNSRLRGTREERHDHEMDNGRIGSSRPGLAATDSKVTVDFRVTSEFIETRSN